MEFNKLPIFLLLITLLLGVVIANPTETRIRDSLNSTFSSGIDLTGNNIWADNFYGNVFWTSILGVATHLSNFSDDLGHIENNASWNETWADTQYASSGSGNASWNETLADDLYLTRIYGLNGGLSTGIITGGLLSVNGGDNTTFDISSGNGIIINNTNTSAPSLIEVTWSAFSGETATYLNSNLITFISINSTGSIVQQTSRWTNSQYRDEIILGVLVHVNKVALDTVNNEHSVVINPVSQIADIFEGLGFINVNGNVITGDGANLKIDKSVGVIMNHGINYFNDPLNPHHLSLGALNQATFQYRVQNGTNKGTGTDVDPDNYDVGGLLTTVPNNKYTIQRFYSFTSNNLKVLYGQNTYSSLNEAKAGLNVDSFVTEPSIVANGVLRGFLIVKKGTTDLSNVNNAFFIGAGKFGTPSGGGATGDNSSWNESYADTLYSVIGSGNASWNESHADTLYSVIGSGNASWNESHADTLYADISVVDTDTNLSESDVENFIYDNDNLINTNWKVNSTATGGLLYLVNNGTTGSSYEIRIDSPNPDIELIEDDQVSPAGKYEIAVNGNDFQINSRNESDNSFETIMEFDQLRQSTGFARLFYNLNITGNLTANYLIGDGSLLTGISGADNTSWNESYADTLYSVIGSGNASWNESHADTLYADISVVTDNVSWNESFATTLYADISVTGDNVSWNESYADTIHEVQLNNEAGLYAVLSDVADFLQSLVDDTTPQLGGYLDTNTFDLGSTTDEIDSIYMKDDDYAYFGNDQDIKQGWNTTGGYFLIG